MFKSRSRKILAKRDVSTSNNVGRKYLYHSQRMERTKNPSDRLNDIPDLRASLSRFKFLHQLPTLLAFLAVTGTLIYISTINDNPQIYITNSSNIKFLHPVSDYRASIKTLLDSSILNKSKFTIDTNKLASRFEKIYPELDSATIVIPISGHKVQLVLKASQPVINLQNTSGYYLISNKGIAILKFSSQTEMNHTDLPTVTDQSSSRVVLGKPFMSQDSIDFIQDVIYQYTSKSIGIQSIVMPNLAYEIDVQSRGDAYFVKYNLLDDAQYQIGTYFETKKYIATNQQPTPTQYIDVRVPGKAFIK